MAVRVIEPEVLGEQTMPPVYDAYGSTSMQAMGNLFAIQSELIALRKRSERQQVYLHLYMLGLVFTACMSIGLSLYLFLQSNG